MSGTETHTTPTQGEMRLPAAFDTIDNAPRDGTIFLACNLDHPSFGVWPMCRRVRHAFNDQGEVETTDLGSWLHLGSIEPDYHDGKEVGPEPSYSVAPDDLNSSVRYGWTPLPAAAPVVGREEIARISKGQRDALIEAIKRIDDGMYPSLDNRAYAILSALHASPDKMGKGHD